MADHTIGPVRATLHGDFSATRRPAITIDAGDRVTLSTLEAGWRTAQDGEGSEETRFQQRDPQRDAGHALTGPIHVRGARPGTVLAVHIEELLPGAWGRTPVAGWDSPWNRRLGMVEHEQLVIHWRIDHEAGVSRSEFGQTVPIRPFLGVMGVAPVAPTWVPTAPPRPQGGNIDCRELVAGSTLYLPVAVEGALLSVGDGHAAQADGELCGNAIECPMERVVLRLDVREDLHLARPRAETPAGWVTFGFHEDLDEAASLATADMLDLIVELTGLERRHALGMASLVVDLRVTQMVNGIKGIHALLSPEGLAAIRGEL